MDSLNSDSGLADSGLARRGLLLGAGATLAAAATAAATVPGAHAAPATPNVAGGSAARRSGSPITSTIASAPKLGYTYKYLSWLDFEPEATNGGRVWGGYGVENLSSATTLWATVDLPAGAQVREIEWYVFNSGATVVKLFSRLWAAGTGTMYTVVLDQLVGNTAGQIIRVTGAVPSDRIGPYPAGTKLCLGIVPGALGDVQLNGARVGFTQGGGEVGLLPTPVRAYNSQTSGGSLVGYQTRTITVPANLRPAGTTGLIMNVTTLGASTSGYLKVYPHGGAVPTMANLYYSDGAPITNQITCLVPPSGQLDLVSNRNTHAIIDVFGSVA